MPGKTLAPAVVAIIWSLLAVACTEKPAQPGAGVATTEAVAPALPDGCTLLPPELSSAQDEFSVSVCLPKDRVQATQDGADEEEGQEAASAPVRIRFLHRGPEGDVVETHELDGDDYAATAAQAQPKLWDNHVLSLDFPQERGGFLLIANWTGRQYVVTQYRYDTGDEDSLQLAWRDGGLVVNTVPEGERRLLAVAAGDDDAGRFVQESVSCQVDAPTQSRRSLSLQVDTAGRVTGLSILALSPAVDGSAHRCSVDAGRFDGQTRWTDAVVGAAQIVFDDGEDGDGAAGQGPREPSRVRVDRDGGRYTVSLQVNPSTFCGQSSELPREMVVERGASVCKSVTD